MAGVCILSFLIDIFFLFFFITPENEQEPGLVLRSIAKTDDGLQQLCRAFVRNTWKRYSLREYTQYVVWGMYAGTQIPRTLRYMYMYTSTSVHQSRLRESFGKDRKRSPQ